MISVKQLKSIDLSSFTTILTGINVLIGIFIAIVATIAIGVTSPGNLGIAIYVIPTIIVISFISGIYQNFSNGLFYNFLSTKLRNINLAFDENKLIKISTTGTATIIAVITLIQVLLLYLVSVLILPLVINATIQTLLFGGQQVLAYNLYQILMLLSQPMTIIMIIFGSFIITFVFVLIGTYIYNFIASKGRAVNLELSEENNLTAIESIDILSFSIAIAIIYAILNLIIGAIMLISGGSFISLITNVLSGLILGFIIAAIFAAGYNLLAPKIGKLKIELIDLKIN
ncbi:MAG: hypothetical protein UHW99_07190 [Methanobrevibacter sp.]|uniref:hypothetical protein n=1 Tax=uncultured Methanobrevibacter sp. TaxID=253161 RepID=UPI0025D17653|nr:hypothetical protein [uncultured Methanobrevibacter sp.]MEE1129751.1 hypothetical protein [Methanobrevibacter sp.]